MSQYDFVETIRCKDANELVEHLRPSNPQWGSGHTNSWIFRGHADSRWKLLPSARRPDGRRKLEKLLRKQCSDALNCTWDEFNTLMQTPSRVVGDQKVVDTLRRIMVRAEEDAVSSFVNLADELGHHVPDLLGRESPSKNTGLSDWSYPWAGMALAQHHKIPTVLLDWTRRPLYAARFAIDATHEPEASNISVWALDTAALSTLAYTSRPSISIETYPLASHDFLRAQDGVFTYCDDFSSFSFMREYGVLPDMLDFASKYCRKTQSCFMKRFDLCIEHVPSLNHILIRERITQAHLMPTLDNVASFAISLW